MLEYGEVKSGALVVILSVGLGGVMAAPVWYGTLLRTKCNLAWRATQRLVRLIMMLRRVGANSAYE